MIIRPYKSFGMERPPYDVLQATIERADSDANHNNRILAANACIDMAFIEPERVGQLIDTAEDLLQPVIECAWTSGGRRAGITKADVRAVEAARHAAMLPNWRAAIAGEAVAPNYPRLLQAATRVLWLKKYDHEVESSLMEFMPVLLGARLLAHGSKWGWIGRMALEREGRGQRTETTNPNWDCGITFDTTPASYISPVRLELKKKKSAGALAYAAAGTILVRAGLTGLAQVDKIVLGCAQEEGVMGQVQCFDEIPACTPYQTHQLNSITGDFRAYCRVQKERYNLPIEIPRRFTWPD